MDPVAQPLLNEALDRLWKQFLPQIEERLARTDQPAGVVMRSGHDLHVTVVDALGVEGAHQGRGTGGMPGRRLHHAGAQRPAAGIDGRRAR